MNKFPQRLKELREDKKLSQTQLAKLTGISQPTITRWENGERVPNIDSIIILCNFFVISADYLIGLTD